MQLTVIETKKPFTPPPPVGCDFYYATTVSFQKADFGSLAIPRIIEEITRKLREHLHEIVIALRIDIESKLRGLKGHLLHSFETDKVIRIRHVSESGTTYTNIATTDTELIIEFFFYKGTPTQTLMGDNKLHPHIFEVPHNNFSGVPLNAKDKRLSYNFVGNCHGLLDEQRFCKRLKEDIEQLGCGPISENVLQYIVGYLNHGLINNITELSQDRQLDFSYVLDTKRYSRLIFVMTYGRLHPNKISNCFLKNIKVGYIKGAK